MPLIVTKFSNYFETTDHRIVFEMTKLMIKSIYLLILFTILSGGLLHELNKKEKGRGKGAKQAFLCLSFSCIFSFLNLTPLSPPQKQFK